MSTYDMLPCDKAGHPYCGYAHKRLNLEERIIRKLIRDLKKAGWMPVQVWDGEGIVVVTTETQTMDAVFAVDESTILFQLKTRVPNQRVRHSVMLALGNGIDVICDYSFSCDDPDGFDTTMGTITDEIIEQFEDERYEL